MFVADGIDEPRPITSMPGVVQHTRDSLRRAAAAAVAAGVGGLMLFGVPRDQDKDGVGSAGIDPDGILNVALRDLAKDLGEATVLMPTPVWTSSPTTGTAVCSMTGAGSITTPPWPAMWNWLWRKRNRAPTWSDPVG